MLPKALVIMLFIVATTLESGLSGDTSIVDTEL